MELTLHDANLKILGWIDNVTHDTLSYSDDLLTKDLPTGASTYRLKIPKRKIKSDLGNDYLYKALNERAWITFTHRGKVYLFNVRDVIEDRTQVELYCENLNMELLNEYANPYSSSKEQTFAQYCDAMELLKYSFLKIGQNEISNEKLSLEFANRETKLARIIGLARAFNAEFEFTVRLNPNSTIKDFTLDVYHGHDDRHHGVGTDRKDLVLNYSNGLRNIRRKVSKKNIFNMIVPIGKRSNSTKSKKTVTSNPDGTKTITAKTTNDNGYVTTVTKVDVSGKVLSTKTVTAVKNSNGTVSKSTSQNTSGSVSSSNSNTIVVTNPDQSTTRTTTTTKSDGTVEKTVVHTKIDKHPDKSTKTTTTTTNPDGSVTERVSWRYANGTSNTTTRLIKSGKSTKSSVVTKVDEASDEEFDLSKMPDWSKNSRDGVKEFYKIGSALYAPISAQLYPSTFTSDTGRLDQWTRRDMEFEADSEEELNGKALAELEKYCYPEIIYEIDGYINGDIGDTVTINDTGFDDTLTITARITKQKISFTNPKSNKTEVANVRAVERMLSSGMQDRLNHIVEESKPYVIQITTDNGVIFKNGIGTSLVTPVLTKGIKEYPEATWRFTFGAETTVGQNYLVNAERINATQILTVAAYIGNDEVASHQLTFANVNDGIGEKGDSVTVSKVEYQAGTSATVAPTGTWSPNVVTVPDGQYLWTKTTYSDGKTAFTVAKQGEKGDTGTFDDDLSVENLLRGTKNMVKKGNTPRDDWYTEGAVLVDETVDSYPFTFKKWSSGAKTAPSIEIAVKSGVKYTFTAYIARENVGRLYFYLYDTWDYHITSATRRETIIQNVGPEIQRFKITFVPTRDGKIRPRFAMLSSEAGWFMAGGYKLNYGKVATDWSQAPEDINQAINSKADQILTQTQLTQLQESNSLLENEIRARLTQQALLDWADEYNKTVTASTDEAKAKAEDALKKSAERLAEVTQLGEKAQKWETTTGYIQADDDGLTIAKDGSDTKFIVTNDVISFVSGGKAVMTLTKGELKVDNGVFALSVRVGRFVEAPFESNPDINVIHYVGEVV